MKRIVLKHIDKPVSLFLCQKMAVVCKIHIYAQVRAIGMESPQLLRLVENCPVGGETLIMRMLYILTENCKAKITALIILGLPSLFCVMVAMGGKNFS